ncbi:hypothetical protein AVEN_193412-1 [Araneus ventricosus]|uniref:Uncharacterized protein n=1 Tax=Araneus ventricosus TaxID=182803 RepID=A0A4Y2M2V7_ARAVE|nr:hypothetical protein AVEN_193412-1 [Araneus ventricosus]
MTDAQSETPVGNCTEISLGRLPPFSKNIRVTPENLEQQRFFAVPKAYNTDKNLGNTNHGKGNLKFPCAGSRIVSFEFRKSSCCYCLFLYEHGICTTK